MEPTATSVAPAVDDPLSRLPTDLDLYLDPEGALARLPTDLDLPASDGVPMETPWHRSAMTLLIDSLECHWRGRKDFFVGGNMFLYFSSEYVFNKDFRGPDVFVVKGVDHDRPRRSWVTWQEGGARPDVIIELASDSTAGIDRGEKKELYGRTLRTAEYFIYDPAGDQLEGWVLQGNSYDQPLQLNEAGRLWSRQLELFLGPWDGEFQGHHARWPRFFDHRGSLIQTFAEAGWEQAETERRRAESEKQRADEAEIEIARLRAELDAARRPDSGNQP